MDLIVYLDKLVYITLSNSYYYSGKVLEADDESITILDKTGKRVSIAKNTILTIREVLR